jgi:NADH-quinone oxidoreductase subunit L
MHSLTLIVFLPLIAAIIAGLGGRWIGNFAAKLITTGALLIGAALSWPILLGFVFGGAEATVSRRATWWSNGRFGSMR